MVGDGSELSRGRRAHSFGSLGGARGVARRKSGYMGTLYCRFTFATGATYICEYSRVIHVRRHFLEHDIFGDGNKPLDTALKTANTLNQSMSKFAELVAVIRGILKVSNAVKNEDLNRRRDDFMRGFAANHREHYLDAPRPFAGNCRGGRKALDGAYYQPPANHFDDSTGAPANHHGGN